MNMLNGIKNILEFLNDNWTVILIITGLAVALAEKAQAYISKSNDEKIAIAKAQIKEIILKLITDAEADYEEWNSAGSIKRAQVMKEILLKYPVLSKAADQDELFKWIDDIIDEALAALRDIISKQL